MNENQVYRELKPHFGGTANPHGTIKPKMLTRAQRLALPSPVKSRWGDFWEKLQTALPFEKGISDDVRKFRRANMGNVLRAARRVAACHTVHAAFFEGDLYLKKTVRTKSGLIVPVTDFGLASMALVTDTGVAFIVDAFQNLVELENMKYHGLGTGTGNEAAGDTALGTELTTEYTGNARATGTTTEGATGNIYKTVATNTLDSGTPAVTEHGVFDQSATGGGTLLDRSKFAAINLVGANGDGLQTDYRLTLSSGG